MPLGELTVGEDLTYQEYPVKILDTSEKSPGITATRCVKCNVATILKKKQLGKKEDQLKAEFSEIFSNLSESRGRDSS
jgi:hypothetical protein